MRCPRCGERLDEPRVLKYGVWTYDETSRELTRSDGVVYLRLTKSHGELVGALMRANGRVVSQEVLYGILYGARPEVDCPDFKIIDVFICRIRRIVRDAGMGWIVDTVYGGGYKMVRGVVAAAA